MPSWMMKFEVEGHIGVEPGQDELVFAHPQGTYRVHVRNHIVEPGIETPLLHMHVMYEAADLATAARHGREHLTRFLQFLSFATGSRFRVNRPVCIFDWSPDVTDQRHGCVYRDFPSAEVPALVMNEVLAECVGELLNSDGRDQDVMQALLWFSSAVSASGPEDQFQLFWFCIETLARRTRDKTPVPDRCPQCHDGLYCRTCAKVSTHRPYPTQAIGQLFDKFVSGDGRPFFKVAGRMRHALMHGDLISAVEEEFGTTLSDLVDDLGRLAWVALLSALLRISPKQERFRLAVMQPSTFLHHRAMLTLQVSAGFALNRIPRFDEIPNFELSMHIVERELTDEERAPTLSPYVVPDGPPPTDPER